jgi:hypothetical protein
MFHGQIHQLEVVACDAQRDVNLRSVPVRYALRSEETKELHSAMADYLLLVGVRIQVRLRVGRPVER